MSDLTLTPRADRPVERDSDGRPAGVEPYRHPYRVVAPGLYAGRISDRVKIGMSMNLPQRVDAFRFEELIAVLPVMLPRWPRGETELQYAYRVRDHLQRRERQIHEALEPWRIRRVTRTNANEWFRFSDDLLRVLAAYGAIVARARVSGRPLSTRFDKGFTPPPLPPPQTFDGLLAEDERERRRLAGLTEAT